MTYKRYKYGLSLTSQFYFCGIPFRLDTTPKCDINCLYCFAMARGGRRTANNLIINTDFVKRKLDTVFINNHKNTDINGELLSMKVPIHFGGISDPFSSNYISAVSLRLLEIFSNYDYPIVLSTKNSDELLKNKTLKQLKKIKNLVIQLSLITTDNKISLSLEPFAPSIKNRIKCLRLLSNEGFYTIVRLQPLIFPWINIVNNELIPAIGDTKCKHVIVEFLKLPLEKNISKFHKVIRLIKWEVYSFYKKVSAKPIGREWILPAKFKWENLKPIIDTIHKNGMTYGSADYGLNHLGDTDCCCGIDRVDGFSGWLKGNFSNIIRKVKKGNITFDNVIQYQFPQKNISNIMNSNCRLTNGNSILHYLNAKWNKPGSENSPDSFWGIKWYGDYDKNKNCIYVKE